MAIGRKTGGRLKGVPNRATAEVKELAQQHGPEAIRKLAGLMTSDDDRVVISACTALLDRGYGRPQQSMELQTDTHHRHAEEMSTEELIAIIENAALGADESKH